ncbi:TonB-dependent receptor [Sphingobium sp. AN558]|uniref:TonB-dependent receptor n=1 Tax=Sphingobium sp. AN558 TaxID=3133442 RepID=UPI0030C5C1D8
MHKSIMLRPSAVLPALLAISASMAAMPALAQAPADETGPGVGDIVVTAQKRAENIQDVPASIAAFSQEALENRQIRGLGDLITRVPSLQVGYTYGSNTLTLRGISTNLTGGFEDPSVAVHVNGVYQARARSLNLTLMDLERIEVLSGPQGTLYGRNATGGVINYILRGPTEQTEAQITGRVGNFDSYALQGYISGPISDTVGFRISGMLDNRDKGFVKNLLPGASKSRYFENKFTGVRGILAFKPSDTVQFDLEGSYGNTRSSFNPGVLAPSLNPARRAVLGPQSFRPREVYADYPSENNSKEYAATATLTWDISDDVQLKSISAYQKYKNTMPLDLDASGFTAQTVFNRFESDTYTQELNLNADSFDGRLKSIFGVYYFNDSVRSASQVLSALANPTAPAISTYATTNRLKARSIAFFTDQTFSVTDSLRLIGGVRYNIDKKDTQNRIIRGGACPVPGNPLLTGDTDQKFTAWTPKAGIQFDVTDKIMAYATYQKGFKAGGVSAGTCGNAYEPETIKGGEVGIKTQFADNRIRLNVAGYWYDYGNLQVQKTLGTIGGFTVLNAAESRIKGIEANLDAVITSRLKLDAAAMVQSAKYTDFVNCNQTIVLPAPQVACAASDGRPLTDPARNQQVAGNWLNRAAPYSLSIGLQYTADVGAGEIMLRGESYWSGRIHFNEFNTAVLDQPAYNIQNAYVTFTPTGDRYNLRAFVKNIRNVDYKASGYFNGLTAQYTVVWNPPRTYGLEASYRF